MSGTEAEPLFALLELMLRTFTANTGPKIKPGGHPEDIFVCLNDEEKEEIECRLCYRILKDVRQCQNKHAFCYSCIFVWSTSGNPINRSLCPVCSVEGLYVRNTALDERINAKIVKCSKNKCKWNGPLEGLSSHQHTKYSEDTRVSSTELPVVANSPAPTPVSNSRSRSRAGSSQISSTPSSQTSVNSRPNAQRQLLGTQSLNNSNNAQTNSRTSQRANGQTTTRSRTRSRHRQNTSPHQRRSNISATGLTNRLTSRARIQNNGTIDKRTMNGQSTTRNLVSTADENQNPVVEQATTETVHVPHPPTTPRSSTITPRPSQTPRRLPTLPNLLPLNSSSSKSNNNNNNDNSNSATNSQTTNTDNNNNLRPTVPSSFNDIAETQRRFTLKASSIRRPSQPRSFGIIRERLNESRQRLDRLMNVFSVELDRGHQDPTSFQEERERRRQEQLAEVRDLGRRLTQVATELRGLLSQRRQIRTQMDNLLESASDDQDE
ncbi:type-2 histone deacetylase 1-like [Ruditapes philippinarum]|uniref:type-2 histone deacetylase 1-like n=1 Tax=Ruditapes philippinarum TaxID=129788 RepID=UPI00295B1F7F|nr:type-2 histone deacetylase 1-like [Ruditapes philippinarum]